MKSCITLKKENHVEYDIPCKDCKHLYIEEMRRIHLMEHVPTVRMHKVGFWLDLLSLAFALGWVGFGLGQLWVGSALGTVSFGRGQLWVGSALGWVSFGLG